MAQLFLLKVHEEFVCVALVENKIILHFDNREDIAIDHMICAVGHAR